MDDLVQSVTCYNSRPIVFHGYLAPFFVLQAAVYYYFSQGIVHPNQQQSNTSISILDKTLNDSLADLLDKKIDGETSRHSYEIAVIAVLVSIVAQVITFLFCHWSVDVKCLLSYTRCKDPYNSRYVKVKPTPNNGATELVPLQREVVAREKVLSFVFQKTKYAYDEKSGKFVAVEFPCIQKISYFKQWKGYDDSEVQSIGQQYGRNELDMAIPTFKELFTERATAPFFVFQTFCVGLWCLDELWYYAVFTLIMLITFEALLVYHQLNNMQEIRQMGNKPFMVQVHRQKKWKATQSDQLVPGDLIAFTRSESKIPCDILLLKGSCIVDESTLTGESVPQMKEPIEDIDDADDRLVDIDQDKLHILYGGTKILQHTAKSSKDIGCLGYVLKTGFHTSQGKLLRTIMFGVKRVTANNFETFCFIMFLLFFALLSAYYVWTKGLEDPKRSRYRLFFECTVIITSVVPPELPIELSLAVNNSLKSLSRLYIYCTEPFRIPLAGKVEYCCFDKTGTLTSDDLIVEGVAGIEKVEESENELNEEEKPQEITHGLLTRRMDSKLSLANHDRVVPIDQCPGYTQQVLASCHSLAYLDDKLVGDPLEKKALEAVNWNFSKSGVVVPKKGRIAPLKIHQRFHFNSTLKRMSVVASYKPSLSNENVYICTAKGAPEFMRPLLKTVPPDYDQLYLEMSRLGARVLALGYRTIGQLSHQELSELKRDDVERDLMFSGFVLISCPLKPDSRAICTELENSGHRLVMITGDGALTACHVASVLNFVRKEVLILTKSGEKKEVRFDHWNWISTDQKTIVPFHESCGDLIGFFRKYDLCLTGESLAFITGEQKKNLAHEIIRRVKVFARVSPKQKELVICQLKSGNTVVLMCGDGTNDVGALKHAQCGVALLSSSNALALRQPLRPRPVAIENSTNQINQENVVQQRGQANKKQVGSKVNNTQNKKTNSATLRQMTPEERRREKILETQAKLKEVLEDQDGPQYVKLGDASIAAPFTSRLSSIQCISHIVKQGRCTLVTTLQMFKILALNALLSAYCHSVLYLDGIKFSDAQITVQGLLTTSFFLFITRSRPLKKLSAQRPLPNIFNLYTILTVTLQFVVHFSALVFLYGQAKLVQEASDAQANSVKSTADDIIDDIDTTIENINSATIDSNNSTDGTSLRTEFKASLVNSTVYIIWMSVQLATFVVNYKGHPFMQSLRNNQPLCYSFIGSAFVVVACIYRWSSSLVEQLSVVEFPPDFRSILLLVIVGDFVACLIIDRICDYLFGRLKLKPL